MDIQRFKQDHREILQGIEHLRTLSKSGITTHAQKIAAGVESLSQTIVRHLAVENRILYPHLESDSNEQLVELSKKFKHGMTEVVNPFVIFARKWKNEDAIRKDPEGFRNDANSVLKRVYLRIRQEDLEFYPVVEQIQKR